MSSILRWTDHLQQSSSKSALPVPQYPTMQLLSCSPIYLPHSFPLKSSLSFKLRQGKLCLIRTARSLSFSEGEDIHLHYICLAEPHCTKTRKISLNPNSRFFFLPDYQRLPRVYEIVPCCTCTIHKGYYIVLHSSSILQIILFCIQPLFHPLNKSFQHWCSKATFMFDGLPATV